MANTSINKAKVNTVKLEQTAEAAKKTLDSYRGHFDSVKKRSVQIDSSWEGPCAEIYKMMMEKDLDILKTAFEKISAYPGSLMMYHGIYSKVISGVRENIEDINTIDLK